MLANGMDRRAYIAREQLLQHASHERARLEQQALGRRGGFALHCRLQCTDVCGTPTQGLPRIILVMLMHNIIYYIRSKKYIILTFKILNNFKIN